MHRSVTTCEILIEGIMGNIYLKLLKWLRRSCPLKIYSTFSSSLHFVQWTGACEFIA